MRKIALCLGLSSTLTVLFTIATAVLTGQNSVAVVFPYGEQYLELALASISAVIIILAMIDD